MERYLDMVNWPRHKTFQFFKPFEHPFFNVCVDLDVTALRRLTRKEKISFNSSILYLLLRATNSQEPFRYRLRDDKVLVHDVVHGGSTVLHDDETFGFWYIDYVPNFKEFVLEAKRSLNDYHNRDQKDLDPRDLTDNVVHISVLPWIKFNSFAHARRHSTDDSVPKYMFGKVTEVGEKVVMPFSVEVHHALMDGLHVGRFLEHFQNLLDTCETLWGP